MRRRESSPIAEMRGVSGAILAVEPLPTALLDEPLDFVLADQLRSRCVCAMLQQFAHARLASRAEADTVVAFLARDLPLHRADKKADLFPLLCKRSRPEDDLGIPLARLTAEHRASEIQSEAIVEVLAGVPGSDPVPISTGQAEIMLAYAARELQNLAVENGILMAIARIRFTRLDIKALSAAMKNRRGIAI
jgi:hypothetical protein